MRRLAIVDGGRFVGGDGVDTLSLAVDAASRAAIEAELKAGASQQLDSIGVRTRSIEHYVFVDPGDPAADIVSPAPLEEADLRAARIDATFWTTAGVRGARIDVDQAIAYAVAHGLDLSS